jgi:hypothetical protein
MSWFSRLARSVSKSVFSNSSEEQFLPQAPTIMAAGSQWYNIAEIHRKDVLERIVKEVKEQTDLYSCIDIRDIADIVIGDSHIGSYTIYLRELHKDFVEDTKEIAQMQHFEKHKRNMRIFFLITRLKIHLSSKLKRLRNKKAEMIFATQLALIKETPAEEVELEN